MDKECELETIENFDKISLYSKTKKIIKIFSNIKIGSDITYIELPSFFLQPISSHEFFSNNFVNHFNLLIKANNTKCPIERMLLVFKYQMTTNLNLENISRSPLIAVTGETKSCNFQVMDLDNQDLIYKDNYYMVEQQQRDNYPNTVCCFYNKRLGIKVNYNGSYGGIFQGTYVITPFKGKFQIEFENLNETYSIIVPPLYNRIARGFSEYTGECRITVSSSPSLLLVCNYLSKPILLFSSSNNYNNLIDCNLYEIPPPNDSTTSTIPINELLNEWKLFNIKGQWDGNTQIKNLKTNEIDEFNSKLNLLTINTKIIPEPLETDSCIVWKPVLEASKNNKDLLEIYKKTTNYYKNLNWKSKNFKFNNKTNIWELIKFK